MLPAEELTQRIIGAAIEVHRALGPGCLAGVCEETAAVEFESMGLTFERQKSVPVLHCGRRAGEHRFDFPVRTHGDVQLKAVRTVEPIFLSTGRSYLRAANRVSGLHANFAVMPVKIRRLGRERSARDPSLAST